MQHKETHRFWAKPPTRLTENKTESRATLFQDLQAQSRFGQPDLADHAWLAGLVGKPNIQILTIIVFCCYGLCLFVVAVVVVMMDVVVVVVVMVVVVFVFVVVAVVVVAVVAAFTVVVLIVIKVICCCCCRCCCRCC